MSSKQLITAIMVLSIGASGMQVIAEDKPANLDPKTPDGAVMLSVKAFQDADMQTLLKTMPAAELAEAKQGWANLQTFPANPFIDGQFDAIWQMLRNDGAVDAMMAEVQPKLATFNPQQMAGLIGMGMLSIPGQLAPFSEFEELTQLNQVSKLQMPLQNWLMNGDLGNVDKAKQAITKLHEWAKAQKFNNLAELKKLSFDEVIDVSSSLVKVGKELGGVYGMDFKAFLASVKAKSEAGKEEGVQRLTVDATIAGQALSYAIDMVQTSDGFWEPKNKDAIQKKVEEVQKAQMEAMMPAGPGELELEPAEEVH